MGGSSGTLAPAGAQGVSPIEADVFAKEFDSFAFETNNFDDFQRIINNAEPGSQFGIYGYKGDKGHIMHGLKNKDENLLIGDGQLEEVINISDFKADYDTYGIIKLE